MNECDEILQRAPISEPATTTAPVEMTVPSPTVVGGSGSRFAVDGGHDRRLRIPFTAAPHTLDRAVSILRAAWDDVRGSTAGAALDDLAAVV